MDHFAVFGNPISQSRSPIIHQAFAKQFGYEIDYQKRHIAIDEFEEKVVEFFDNGGKGLNITVPFKHRAFLLAQVASSESKLAQAANTLWMENGVLHADTTDGGGLLLDLIQNNIVLENKNILIIGAGGAVSSIIKSLLNCAPNRIDIANRTQQKASVLVQAFNNQQLRAILLSDCANDYDVIINGTSASLYGELPAVPSHVFDKKPIVYDMVYQKSTTCFNQWASDSGATKTLDGAGMLVGQAALSFERWYGKLPEIKPVLTILQQYL